MPDPLPNIPDTSSASAALGLLPPASAIDSTTNRSLWVPLLNGPGATASVDHLDAFALAAAVAVMTGPPFPCRHLTVPASSPPTTTLNHLRHTSHRSDFYALSTRPVLHHDRCPRLHRRKSMRQYSVNHRAYMHNEETALFPTKATFWSPLPAGVPDNSTVRDA